MTELLLLLLLAAWAGADMTAAGQLMISQPLIAAWLAGLVMGDPAAGLGVGLLLQVVWGGVLPLGGSTFPLSGPAAVAAAGIAARIARTERFPAGDYVVFPSAWALAAALVAALVAGEIGGRIVVTLRRRRNAALAGADAAAARGDAGALVRLNFRGVLEDAVVGAAVGGFGLALGLLLLDLATRRDTADGAWVALAVAGIGIGLSVRSLGPSRIGRVFTAVALAAAAAWRLFA